MTSDSDNSSYPITATSAPPSSTTGTGYRRDVSPGIGVSGVFGGSLDTTADNTQHQPGNVPASPQSVNPTSCVTAKTAENFPTPTVSIVPDSNNESGGAAATSSSSSSSSSSGNTTGNAPLSSTPGGAEDDEIVVVEPEGEEADLENLPPIMSDDVVAKFKDMMMKNDLTASIDELTQSLWNNKTPTQARATVWLIMLGVLPPQLSLHRRAHRDIMHQYSALIRETYNPVDSKVRSICSQSPQQLQQAQDQCHKLLIEEQAKLRQQMEEDQKKRLGEQQELLRQQLASIQLSTGVQGTQQPSPSPHKHTPPAHPIPPIPSINPPPATVPASFFNVIPTDPTPTPEPQISNLPPTPTPTATATPLPAETPPETSSNTRSGPNICLANYIGNDPDLSLYYQIDTDVLRTYPFGFSQALATPNVRLMLKRILFIWAKQHDQIGYFQGLNEIPTIFMIVFLLSATRGDLKVMDCLPPVSLQFIEADTFFCLSKVMEQLIPLASPSNGFIFAQEMIESFRTLLVDTNSRALAHLERNGVMLHHFAFRWFLCLLLRDLKITDSVVLFDHFIAFKCRSGEYKGFVEFLPYVCTELLNSIAPHLVTLNSLEAIIGYIQKLYLQPPGHINIKRIVRRAAQLYANRG
ncbi:GTPase activating protein [Pelomyxa schiedti]|nr:GTPase activating protein [Pelomyxa schiedti]